MRPKDESELTLQERIGQRIRAARIRVGLNPIDVIEMTGVSRSQYYYYEMGQGTMTLDNLGKITAVLGCSLSELLRDDEEERRGLSGERLQDAVARAKHLLVLINADERRLALMGGDLLAAIEALQQLSADVAPKPGRIRVWAEVIAAGLGAKRLSRKRPEKRSM